MEIQPKTTTLDQELKDLLSKYTIEEIIFFRNVLKKSYSYLEKPVVIKTYVSEEGTNVKQNEIYDKIKEYNNFSQDIIRREFLKELNEYTGNDTIVYATSFSSRKRIKNIFT